MNNIQLAPKRKRSGPPKAIDKYIYGKEYRRLRDLIIQHELKHNEDSFRKNKKILRAAILLFAGLEIGTNDIDKLYRYLGYNIQKYCIQDMASRLRKNKIWIKGNTRHDWNDQNGYIAFLCDSMVAIGILEKSWE